MACENHDDVIAIDAGTGFVKCVCSHMRATFPSVYATRRMTRWEDPKEGIVEAVGYEAVRMRVYPDALVVRAVLEGRAAEERAFVAIIREAARRLGCIDRIGGATIVMGLPYEAAEHKQALEKIVERSLKPSRVLVIPQSIGTLLSEDARTGLVVSIGQGTTELMVFEDLKPVTGLSMSQACDYLYDGLEYLEYEQIKPEKRRLDNFAALLANHLAEFESKLAHPYEVYLSGGGVLIDDICKLLEARIRRTLHVAKDPVYSNALGLYKLGCTISSSGGPKGISLSS
jgi:actin-like ATPase involved in cell morphogenesis